LSAPSETLIRVIVLFFFLVMVLPPVTCTRSLSLFKTSKAKEILEFLRHSEF
jgi:hypothetical protein